ncbi:hypothetical protein HAZT_HAZT001605, partial [Hyalella azteca]
MCVVCVCGVCGLVCVWCGVVCVVGVVYVVYVVWCSALFNRAKLLNVGFVEAMKAARFDCIVFHDVDMLPEDDRHLYHCAEQPRHMVVASSNNKY